MELLKPFVEFVKILNDTRRNISRSLQNNILEMNQLDK